MNNLLFDFTIDKEVKMVFTTREFDAERSLAWDVFTKAAIQDQWTSTTLWVSRPKFIIM